MHAQQVSKLIKTLSRDQFVSVGNDCAPFCAPGIFDHTAKLFSNASKNLTAWGGRSVLGALLTIGGHGHTPCSTGFSATYRSWKCILFAIHPRAVSQFPFGSEIFIYGISGTARGARLCRTSRNCLDRADIVMIHRDQERVRFIFDHSKALCPAQ